MDTEIYTKTEYLIKHWWLSLLTGGIAIAIGFIVLVNPSTSYYTFALWLGIAILLSGIMGLMQSLTSHNYFVRRGWLIVADVMDIIIGIILLFNTLLSEVILPILLGAWVLYRGATMLAQGFDMRNYGTGEAGWVIFYAAVIIAIGIAIIWLPTILGAETVVLFVAVAFITYGISMMSVAFRLWDIHRHARALGSDM